MRHQRAFTAHIREPETQPCPADVEDRRMGIYRELFYNNIESFIAQAFPVLRSVYPDNDWHKLIREFFAHHQCKTPLFAQISEEFLAFLQNEHRENDADPPFLLELAHYEWIELAVSIADDPIDFRGVDRNGDLMKGIPVMAPYTQVLQYHFPVHRISPDYCPQTPDDEQTFLVVYRDRQDNIGFLQINAVTALLLTLVKETENNGEAIARQIAEETQHPDVNVVVRGAADILADMRAREIVLGTRR